MIVQIAYADIRNAQPAPDTVYFMTDPGRQGFWYQNLGPNLCSPTDTDNGWCCIVTTNGTVLRRDLSTEQPRLSWAGILPGYGPDASPAFNTFLQSLPEDVDLPAILVAAGSYNFYEYTIRPGKRKLSLISAGGQVNFFGGTGALLDITTSGGQFEHIVFIGSLGPETLDAQGNKSLNQADYLTRSLVRVGGVTRFHLCEFNQAGGHGVYVYGNLGLGIDSSLSSFSHCKFRQNRGAGRYIGGMSADGATDWSVDANHLVFFDCDQRDNGLEGSVDASFLGNIDIASHGNNNAQGHNKITNPNNIAVMVGAYEEDGSPSSMFTGQASVLGSRLSGTPQIGPFVLYNQGHMLSSVQTPTVHITSGGTGLAFQGPGDFAPLIALQSAGSNNQTLYQLVNLNEQLLPILQIYGSGTPVPVPGRNHTRVSATNGINLARFREGNLDVVYVDDYSELQTAGGELRARDWLPGDEVRRYLYDPAQPFFLLCQQAGNYSATFPVVINGQTNPNSGGGIFIDNAQASYVPVGTAIQFNGIASVVTGQQVLGQQTLLFTSAYYPAQSATGTVTPPQPIFVAVTPQTTPWP